MTDNTKQDKKSESQANESSQNSDNPNKNKRGSNRMEPNKLKPDYNNYNKQKYLKVSVHSKSNRAGVAEWSTQSVETRCPSGCVGSIPTPSAMNSIVNNQNTREGVK